MAFRFLQGIGVGYSDVPVWQILCSAVARYSSAGTLSFAAFHLHTADQSHVRLGQAGQACLEDLGLVWRHCGFAAAVLHAQLKLRVVTVIESKICKSVLEIGWQLQPLVHCDS